MNEGQLIVSPSRRLLSAELEQKLDLSNSQIQELGSKVRKYKKQMNETFDKMDDFMDKQTEKERAAVQEALKNLNKKIEKVKADETYQNYEKDIQHIEKKLNITMENIFPYYAKAVRKIHDAYPEKAERSQKLIEFHEVVSDAFLSKDEKKILTLIRSQIKEIPHKVINIPLLQ